MTSPPEPVAPTGPPGRRLPAVIVIVALLVVGLVVDRQAPASGGGAGAGRAAVLATAMPSVAPATALSSSWYCPGATAVPGGQADGTVVIANVGARPLDATVTVVPSTGTAKAVPVTVGPRSRTTVHEADVVQAPQAAVLVELRGGGGAVEQQVDGPSGRDVTPCASTASDHWFFATGSTDKGDSFLLALFNPFPGDAIIDLSFVTGEGPTVPADFQGLVVPARGLRVVDVGEHVRRRPEIATSIVARTGRVVAGRLQTRTTPAGMTDTLGAPSVGTEWTFPDGLTADAVTERYHVFNPGSREAQVVVDLALDQGDAEPVTLSVPPLSSLDLLANDEPRIPKGVGHAAVVRTTNGAAIVVERTIEAVKPAIRTGLADILGSPRSAARWVLAAGGTGSAQDETVALVNPGDAQVTASFSSLGGPQAAVPGLDHVEVPAGRRTVVRLGDHLNQEQLSLLVSATGPVVVERDLARVGKPGLAATIGIPLR